jgi:hypothetical protein
VISATNNVRNATILALMSMTLSVAFFFIQNWPQLLLLHARAVPQDLFGEALQTGLVIY